MSACVGMSDEKKLPRILICVLSTYERSGWFSKELTQWMESLRFERNYLTSVGYAHNFAPASAARNYICKHVKDLPPSDRPDWLLMIDNDMVPPGNLLNAIDHAPEDAGVVVPRFYMWDQQKACPILCWGMDDANAPLNARGDQIFKVEPGKYYRLTKAGTGAMFVRPELLDELQSPFFYYTFDENGSRTSTEDINFCIKEVAKTKWKIYGASDIEVGHFHNVDLAQLAKWLYQNEAKKQEVEELPAPAECFR